MNEFNFFTNSGTFFYIGGRIEGVAERISNYCLAQEYFECFGSELIFSTNENISCHSARVIFPGNYKKAR